MPAPTSARRKTSALGLATDRPAVERITPLRRGYSHRQYSVDLGVSEIDPVKELAQRYQLPFAAVIRLLVKRALGHIALDDPVVPDAITMQRNLGPQRRRTRGGR